LALVLIAAAPAAGREEGLPLAVVGADTIRAGELDSLLIETHRGMSGEEKAEFDYRNLLDKLINDRLILQEARAIGMQEEPEIVEPVREETRKRAVARFVRETFVPPDSTAVTEAAVREEFERFYWKIELRQITVRDRATADSLVRAIRAGASMDSLARARSIDPMAARGGLHNFKHWADVEIPLREASRDLEPGEVSEPFPYRGVVSIVRVEKRGPVDEEAFDRLGPSVRSYLHSLERDRAYRAYLAEKRERAGIRTRRDVLQGILADSAEVLTGEFLDAPEESPAVEAADGRTISEGELRREISHMKMENATLPFDSLLQRSLEKRLEDLVLTGEAIAAGYLDKPEIRAGHRRRLNEALVNAYLSEFIGSQITFDREEFQEYYEEHRESFRGPDEIQVDVIVVEEEPVAREIADRLEAGADFGFLKQKYTGADPAASADPKWVKAGLFSAPIAQALEDLDPGETTGAFDMRGRWGVFKLLDRRPGRIPEMEEVDMQIRRALFQRRFNTLLDEHLAALEEAVGVERFEENIERYFGGEGGEG
ncbi:MAG: hypothetical protein GF346_12385, partial [Candidatus Eisenbacteria bacterium]|nr:hypothetical protein [Candidatus Latescibacterota bacterium]MBD3303234.1 hypothetical protein [Candidatus Eisenbacteria bacterium]